METTRFAESFIKHEKNEINSKDRLYIIVGVLKLNAVIRKLGWMSYG